MAALLMICNGAKAQDVVKDTDGRYPVYCTVMMYNFWGVGKVKCTVDFGNSNTWEKAWKRIDDENGDPIKFTSNMAAINYLAKRGWELDKTVFLGSGKNNVLHYILKKMVRSDDEILQGLHVRDDVSSERVKSGDDMFDAGIEK